MTYYESSTGITITRKRALQEIKNHGLGYSDFEDFMSEYGDKAEYQAQDVLNWLGY